MSRSKYIKELYKSDAYVSVERRVCVYLVYDKTAAYAWYESRHFDFWKILIKSVSVLPVIFWITRGDSDIDVKRFDMMIRKMKKK